MTIFNRDIDQVEAKAVLWWPKELIQASAILSVIPKLLETQDSFLKIISLSRDCPYQVFEILKAARFPANLFLKHLCVLADYGGEPIQRLGRSFDTIFQPSDTRKNSTSKKYLSASKKLRKFRIEFTWESNNYVYDFKSLPLPGLNNKKLFIDSEGLIDSKPLDDLYKDMIIILMFGSSSTVSHEAGLSACEIGTLLGRAETIENYVRERYIHVSRITGGAEANSLGQLAQQEITDYLIRTLEPGYKVIRNGCIILKGYDKVAGMPFDIVVEKGNKRAGIEVSFQVTTNSTIERKAGQAADRIRLMHSNGYKIAYVLDGAGNFQRKAAAETICRNSDCTVAYSHDEFEILVQWLRQVLG